MKIVSFAELLTCNPGTVFCRFEPYCFDGLFRFESANGENDFVYTSLLPSVDFTDGVDVTIFVPFDADGSQRWAQYNTTQYFLIYSAEELKTLSSALLESTGKNA